MDWNYGLVRLSLAVALTNGTRQGFFQNVAT